MTDSRHWFDKTLSTLKKAGEAVQDGVQRTYQTSTLKIEISSLRRALDDVKKQIGTTAVDVLREKGQLGSDQVAPLLRRVDELEDQIAAKERLVADLERDPEPAPATGEPPLDGDATMPSTRRGPSFTSTGAGTGTGAGKDQDPPSGGR